jgi:hypothetical protein
MGAKGTGSYQLFVVPPRNPGKVAMLRIASSRAAARHGTDLMTKVGTQNFSTRIVQFAIHLNKLICLRIDSKGFVDVR